MDTGFFIPNVRWQSRRMGGLSDGMTATATAVTTAATMTAAMAATTAAAGTWRTIDTGLVDKFCICIVHLYGGIGALEHLFDAGFAGPGKGHCKHVVDQQGKNDGKQQNQLHKVKAYHLPVSRRQIQDQKGVKMNHEQKHSLHMINMPSLLLLLITEHVKAFVGID